jgi:hypothetical protein
VLKTARIWFSMSWGSSSLQLPCELEATFWLFCMMHSSGILYAWNGASHAVLVPDRSFKILVSALHEMKAMFLPTSEMDLLSRRDMLLVEWWMLMLCLFLSSMN